MSPVFLQLNNKSVYCFCLETPWIHVKILSGAAVALFGLPLTFVTNGSVFSKLLPGHVQGNYVYNCLNNEQYH